MNKRLRISYSLLNCWERGLVQEAVSMYFHLAVPASPAAQIGRKIHQEIADFILREKSLPGFLPRFKLANPQPEIKLVTDYGDRFCLSGVLDLLDDKTIFEWKTGNRSCLKWATTNQIPFYFLLTELAGIKVEKAILAHTKDQKQSDWVCLWKTDAQVKKAANLIDALGPEIYDYFLAQGLL